MRKRRDEEPKKITWEYIYEDFKRRHPTLRKRVYGFRPYSYATILLFFPDRLHITYNYDTKYLAVLNDDIV